LFAVSGVDRVVISEMQKSARSKLANPEMQPGAEICDPTNQTVIVDWGHFAFLETRKFRVLFAVRKSPRNRQNPIL
jgi:hypothetical protein